ncbi:IDEAL domain-containing protein [Alicyclobacillus tolerans]|uniref:IDEAL domain-containing protein n=1 Tax=Alicyclobacillus tolerans TaxID=90970 RepID=UPI001F1B38BA|nr:IDEAL domain-containing protein [Alicyclobacillus tolerans]MCF8564224.1 IDEAL domain-containing protein [Alicyclobacillus tolerans]
MATSDNFNPRISEWVSFYSPTDHVTLTGFILFYSNKTVCIVHVPHRGIYKVSVFMMTVLEPSLQPSDLSALVDLALDTKDEQWFHELASQLQNCY